MKKRLSIAYCALEAFRLSFLSFSYWLIRGADGSGYEGAVLPVFCAAAIVGMAAAPPLLARLGYASGRRVPLLHALIAPGAVFAIMSSFFTGAGALVAQFLAVMFVSGALAMIMGEVSQSEIKPGQTAGAAYAVACLLSAVLFYIPGALRLMNEAVLAVMCALIVTALAALSVPDMEKRGADAAGVGKAPECQAGKKRAAALFALALLAMALTERFSGGAALLGAVGANPSFFMLLLGAAAALATGALFERAGWRTAMICGFLCIVLGRLAVSIGGEGHWQSIGSGLTNAGCVAALVLAAALPVRNAGKSIKRGVYPSIGYIVVYIGLIIGALASAAFAGAVTAIALPLVLSIIAFVAALFLAREKFE